MKHILSKYHSIQNILLVVLILIVVVSGITVFFYEKMASNPKEGPTDNLLLDKPATLPLPPEKSAITPPNLPTTPESKPELVEQPSTSSRLPEPKKEFSGEIKASITYPITILGKKGFDPKELTIKVGDKVTWTNSDPANKKLVLTFQKDKLVNVFQMTLHPLPL